MNALSNQLEDSIAKLSDLTMKLPKRIQMINQEIGLCDQEINDIHHLIEMTRLNASDGYKAYRDLQITLLKRRELKDELDMLASLRLRMRTKDMLGAHTTSMKHSIAQRKQNKASRTYSVRVRTDLAGRSEGIVIR